MDNRENFALPFGSSFKNLVTQYPSILFAVLGNILLRIIVLAPALYAFKTQSNLLLLCSISAVLYLFVVVPLRASFAQAMESAGRTRKFDPKRCFSYQQYAEKLGFQCKQGLKLIPWALPMIAVWIGVYCANEYLDFVSNSRYIRNLGEAIFGVEAGVVEGGYIVLLLFFLTVLLFIWGIVRNSADRYLRMSPIRYAIKPDAEIRRCLIKQRGKQFLFAVLNFLLLLPAVFPITLSWVQEYIKTQNIVMFLPNILNFNFNRLNIALLLLSLIILLPFRRMINASFAANCRYHREHEKAAA